MSTRMTARLAKTLMVILSAAMLVTLFVPAQAEAQGYYYGYGNTPCPHYSIQNVFDDQHSDWDNDRITNITELYNGLNPCVNDSAGYCANNAWNCGALVAQNPCATVSYYYYSGYNSTYYAPITGWTWAHVNADPHGDWDHDGVSNHAEAKAGANPCVTPCGHGPRYVDFQLNPNGDWDRDGVSNSAEKSQGTDPCNRYSYYIQQLPHVTTLTLPHVDYPPAGYKCPYGYPYYHPGNGLCYANPVGHHY